MALGARARHVRALVLGEAVRLAAIGFALGLAGAYASGRVLSGMLFGVAPMDPSTLAAAAAVLVFTIVAACYFPIRRAARIDPGALLRDA